VLTPHGMKVIQVHKTVVKRRTPWKNRSWVVGVLTSEREVAVDRVEVEVCEPELLQMLETLVRYTFLDQLINVANTPTSKTPSTEPKCPSELIRTMDWIPFRLIPFQPAKSTISVSTINIELRYPDPGHRNLLNPGKIKEETVVGSDLEDCAL
jgi:hypothetical protein